MLRKNLLFLSLLLYLTAAWPAPARAQEPDSVVVVQIGSATVYNGEWVDPPLAWEMAYAWTERCLGRRGNFARIRFGVADSIIMYGRRAVGMWYRPDSEDDHGDVRIIVFDRAEAFWNAELHIHEDIHDITNGRGGEWPTPVGERESKYFRKCLPSLRTTH